MTISDSIRNFMSGIKPKYLDLIHGGLVETDKHALLTAWFYSPVIGQPRGGTPISTMRKFAQTPQVKMCTKTIIDEITGIEYNIVPTEKYKDNFNKETAEEVRQFFEYPNRNGESFDEITKMLLGDVYDIDAGVIVKTFADESKAEERSYTYTQEVISDDKKEKVTNIIKASPLIDDLSEEEQKAYNTHKTTARAKLVEMYARDGGSFILAPDQFGILPEDRPAYFQYSFVHPRTAPLGFFKREIVYFKMNPRSSSPYGFAPIESIFMILESLNNAVRYNKQIFEQSAIPSGALSVIGAKGDDFKRFMSNWKKNIKGKPHKVVVFNEDMKWTPFNMANRDMEWLEGQRFYQKLVWAMFGVTADELGFTDTSNRSVGQSQSRVFVRRAIRPSLEMLEQKFTNEVIAEFYPDGECEMELKYDFIDIHEEDLKRNQEIADVKANIRTINEVRLDRGLDPVPWGDEKSTQPNNFNFGNPSNNGDDGNQNPKPKDNKSIKKKINFLKKVAKASSYAKFLENYWEAAEAEVLEIFNEEQTDILKGNRVLIRKSWAGFLRRLTHLFSTSTLIEQISKYINEEYNKGIAQAEAELNLDIGIRGEQREIVNHYVKQQVDGYVLPNGKRWNGIKGVNADLQLKIGDRVVESIREGKGSDEIAKDIKEVFDTTTSRAKLIARTEGQRIRNEAHLKSYYNAGIEGDKKWIATMDSKTDPTCRELNGQIVPLSATFKTSDGKEYLIPPEHPNCRCRIGFVPK